MGLFDKLKKSLFGEQQDDEENKSAVEENDDQSAAKQSETTDKDEAQSASETTDLDSKLKNDAEQVDDSTDLEAELSAPTAKVAVEKTQDASKSNDDASETPEPEPEPESSTSEPSETEALDSESTSVDDTKESDEKYEAGLQKSRNSFAAGFNHFLAKFRSVDNQFFDDLEDFLIESDVGYELAMDLSDQLKEMVKEENLKTKEQIGQAIIEYLVNSYQVDESTTELKHHEGLNIYLFVGVNGAGKTTTIGKLANRFVKAGKKVILVAGDTFRAGATEQLDRWATRTGAEIVKGKTDQDPSSLVFEGIHRAQEENADYLMIDTAGRLQNKVNLMNELDKIKRTIKKEAGTDPTETLLVIDATTGQNGLSQAKEFNQVTKLTGLVLSKLDGTAKGGIVLQIKKSLNIPVKLVGLGEQVDDLVDFKPDEFMRGFFSGILQV
ncbi:signal recognition particle-docking protein FtsY [Xylocopilactobacillus apicola]|uniref:Signal recognition particle receptor FtsY n=1 Tax=Xylocopilactobacillus apicola TaxID=2932184 RepID=A0AAU9D784_9LACO|nr:signal recognition particle-docking protein FtsY [Xylocopilactobacillus apicola]BDR58175.1 signal recognition particle receptor FtsY [Xylocopilactobacillus apicola]